MPHAQAPSVWARSRRNNSPHPKCGVLVFLRHAQQTGTHTQEYNIQNFFPSFLYYIQSDFFLNPSTRILLLINPEPDPPKFAQSLVLKKIKF